MNMNDELKFFTFLLLLLGLISVLIFLHKDRTPKEIKFMDECRSMCYSGSAGRTNFYSVEKFSYDPETQIIDCKCSK